MADNSAAPSVAVPAAPTSLDEALTALFTLGVSTLHARRGSLYLRAAGDASLRLHDQRGMSTRDGTERISSEGTVAGMVMSTRVPLLVQNVASYPALPAHPERYATPSFISVPLLVENDAIGVLNAADRRDGRPFSENDLQSAEMVARSIAVVLHSDLLARRALDEGEIDPVSGLYNARYLERRLAQEVRRAQRSAAVPSLLLLSVGGYADVAARIGAQEAGVLMRYVGEMVARTVRQSDVLARRSPAEIAVLMPSTPLEKARRIARILTRDVVHEKLPAQLRYDCEDLGISIGVASLTPSADAMDLVRHAEEALEMARTRGNAIVVATGDEMTELARRAPPPVHHEAISTALRLGIPYLADPAAAAMASAVRLLSLEVARTYLCFPVAFEAGTLTLAMADPADSGAIHAISQLTHMAVYPVASPREKILQAITTLMRDHRRRPSHEVHIRIPATTDRDTFARQMARVTQILDTLNVRDLALEGTVSALPAPGANRKDLLTELAALSDLPLHPDERNAAVLHLRDLPEP